MTYLNKASDFLGAILMVTYLFLSSSVDLSLSTEQLTIFKSTIPVPSVLILLFVTLRVYSYHYKPMLVNEDA